MKLQFAWGNPRKGAKKTRKTRKKVARGRKKHKTGGVTKSRPSRRKSSSALRKKLRGALQMAKRKHHKRKVRGRKHLRRKNPAHMLAYKTKDGKKKLVGSAKFLLKHEYQKKIENESKSLKHLQKLMADAKDPATKSMVGKRITRLKQMLAQKYIDDANAQRKYMQRLEEEGAEIKHAISQLKEKGKPVAKKKKPKKPRKAAKKAAKKGGSKKGSKKTSKGRKKGRSKAQKAALKKMQKAAAAARKAKSKKSSKKKTKKKGSRKMVTHTHAKSTRHIRRGATAHVSSRKKKRTYRVKTYFGKGKKKVKMTGRLHIAKKGGVLKGLFKINPFRSNPLKNLKPYLGLDVAELGSLAAGGALVPLANGLVGKYAPKVASTLAQYVGPQAAGSVLPILAGVALNAVAEHGVRSGTAHEYLKKGGEGLVAAGVIGLAMSMAQKYVNPALGLAGINYTPMGILPQMNGINYTPMSGINYTPMGIMPQLAGPDFGAADYGGDGGSYEASTQRSDFGAWQSADSEFESENSFSASMN